MLVSKVDTQAPVEARLLLVLDDEPDVCTTIAYIGEQVGMQVRTVHATADFSQALLASPPDVIVLDLLMPGSDGIEMLHMLHAGGCKAGIIVNSGVEARVLEAAGRTARELGLNLLGTLAKPFSPRALRAMLERAVAEPSRSGIPAVPAQKMQDMATIDAGLRARQFCAHYQPKIRCLTGEVEGVEALVRWHHPELGILSPDKFLPQVERSPHLETLTEQVVEQSLAWLASIPALPKLGMAINLSPRLLGNLGLADMIEAKCNDHGVDPARITLEITEASAMEDPIAGLAVTTRFCMKAFKLSIDDFGVGYSSFVQLARLPFAELKIDRQFVSDLPHSLDNRAIVEAIVLMAHRLGLSVTAEGVENMATLNYLAAIGCDNAQGYGIARPLDPATARQWVLSKAQGEIVRLIRA